MFNHNEVDEREYLVEVQVKLRTAFERIDLRITDYYNEILETKRYIYENLAQFDAAEKAANRIAVYESVTFGEEAIKERERLQKLMMSPYFGSSEFKEGIVVTSVHMSKGLEFDQVIVPDASEDHFCTELDRSLLYIACTRAMHQLDLTCVGKKTKWTVVNDNSPVSLTGCDYSRS